MINDTSPTYTISLHQGGKNSVFRCNYMLNNASFIIMTQDEGATTRIEECIIINNIIRSSVFTNWYQNANTIVHCFCDEERLGTGDFSEMKTEKFENPLTHFNTHQCEVMPFSSLNENDEVYHNPKFLEVTFPSLFS